MMKRETDRLRDQHRATLALVKAMPLGPARHAALQQLDALAVKICGVETRAKSEIPCRHPARGQFRAGVRRSGELFADRRSLFIPATISICFRITPTRYSSPTAASA